MKYRFSIPSRIRTAVEWHLEHYPEDRRQLERYKAELIPSPTQAYSLTGGVDGGEAHRSTEDVVFKIMSSSYLRMLEITCGAVEKALQGEDETGRKLVELVYWKREYTVEGAGMKLGLSRSGAYKRLNQILSVIAFEIGYVSV